MDIQVNEHHLITACKKNKLWAQKELYELYAPKMLALCMRYVYNRETAKDLLQDGFIIIFTKIHTYMNIGSFEGWMRKVFVNIALSHLKTNHSLKTFINIDDYEDVIEDFDNHILDKISADELLTCIRNLPEGYRTIFNLYAIEGYSHVEIAEILGIKESTSRSQFARAKRVLQQNIQKRNQEINE